MRYSAVPSAASIDALTALSPAAGAAYGDYAVLVRFNTSNQIDARNGGIYAALSAIPYSPGITYNFRLRVNVPLRSYDVYVAEGSGAEQLVGSGFAFRTEQSGAASLANRGIYAFIGSHTVCNFSITDIPSSSSSSSASSVSSSYTSSAPSSISSTSSSSSPPSSSSRSSASSSSSSTGSLDLGDLTVDASRLPYIDAFDSIPVDTSSWTVVNYTGAKTGTAVTAAINAAAPRTILVLPAGTYSGAIVHRKSQVVVRGQCQDRSLVRWVHSGFPDPDGNLWGPPRGSGGYVELCQHGWLSMCGAIQGDSQNSVEMDYQTWSGPYTRGTSTVSIANATNYQVGDVVLLQSDQLDLPDIEYSPWTPPLTYIAEVKSKQGNSLTLDRSLPVAFGPANASVVRLKMLVNAGIECMTLQDTDVANPEEYNSTPLAIRRAYKSWVSNVDFGDTFYSFGSIRLTARSVLTGNRFGEQMKSTMGDGNTCDGSGGVEYNPCWNKNMMVFESSHDNSFINNVVYSSIGLQPVNGTSRNWIAYNYFATPRYHPREERRRWIFFHGGYAHENLVEGNLAYGAIEMDQTWGSQGPNNALFRNISIGTIGPMTGYVTEAQTGGSGFDPTARVSKYTSFILNFGTRFGFFLQGQGIDARHDYMHLERNVYTSSYESGGPYQRYTSEYGNYDATLVPLGNKWDTLHLPNSLNRGLAGAAPSFWCSQTVLNGGSACDFQLQTGSIGAAWDGRCKLPAQVKAEGGLCTPLR